MVQGQIHQAASPPAARQPLDRRIFLLAFAALVTFTDAYLVAGILPLIAQDFGVTPGAVGQLLTVHMLIIALGAPVLAVLTAAYPRGRLMIVSLACYALAAGLCAAAPWFGVLVLARCLAAFCAAIYSPVAFGTAAALSPVNRRGAGLAAVALGLVSAPLIGVPVATWVGQHFGWRASFALDVILIGAVACALATWRIPEVPSGPPLGLGARFSPLTSRRVIFTVLPSLFIWMGVNNIYLYSSTLFGQRLGTEAMPLLLASFGIGGVIGSQTGGRLVDRFGATMPMLACLSISIIDLGTLNLTGASFSSAAAALFTMSFCGWALYPMQQARLVALKPEHSALVIALNNSAANIGTAIGAALVLPLLDHFSVTALPYAASGVTLLALGLFLLDLLRAQHHAKRRRSRDRAASAGAFSGDENLGSPSETQHDHRSQPCADPTRSDGTLAELR